MADNTAARSHLASVESTLTDMRNINSITDLVNVTSLKLFDVLWWQNLLIDDTVRMGLERIRDDLQNWWTNLWGRVQQKIIGLNTERTIINPWWKNATRVAEIWREINDLHNIANDAWVVTTNVQHRHTEYNNLYDAANRFDLDTTLNNLNINVTATPRTWTTTIDVEIPFTGAVTPHPSFELCDDKWDKLTRVWSNYQVVVWSQTYTLWWINFTGTPVQLNCSNITINPAPTTMPLDIKLSINAIYPVTVWLNTINVTCNKKLNLTLNDWTIKVDTDTLRRGAFDDYENSWWVHAVSEQLNTKINVRDNDPEIGKNVLERKAIEAALKYKWGTKYDTLSDKQKRLFYERVCRVWFFTGVYTWWWLIDVGNARYTKMRTWYVNGWRPWNNDKSVIWSASAYKTYLHSHLDEKCDEYILTTLQNYLQEDTRNTALKAELSKFLQEIDNNKLDDDHVNTDIHRDLNDKRYKMKKGPVSLFHPRDVNYMRFLSGASTSLKDQKVNIYTKIDNPEPVEYDMNLSVTWKNNIEVEIKIKWTDEVIKQKSSQPATLVRKIMREQRIKHGKVRAHIGFNIYKSVIRMAQERDISLTYRGMEWKMRWNRLHKSRETRKITLDKKWNIAIKQIDHMTTTSPEKDVFVFDQDAFLNANEFDTGQTNWRLREWLETLGYHFNMAMEHLHKQYRKWTERRLCGLLYSKNTMRLPTSFWLSPIKKILNAKTVTNFDFSTTVNSNWKNIKIDFRKSKFTINMDWLKKPLKWRDLWRLLNHREGKVRVFDGMERDITEWIYSSLVDNLRKNAKIARTSFWVKDDITWNMYVLDEDGTFWVIAREDFKWSNKVKNPLRGWFRGWKKSWMLKKKRLDEVSWRPLEAGEKKELLKNPFLMQKFVKAMNRRMGLRWSIAAMF